MTELIEAAEDWLSLVNDWWDILYLHGRWTWREAQKFHRLQDAIRQAREKEAARE